MTTRPAHSSDHVLGLAKLRGRGAEKFEAETFDNSSSIAFENPVQDRLPEVDDNSTYEPPYEFEESELAEERKDSTSGVLGGASETPRSGLSAILPESLVALEHDIISGILDAFGGSHEFAMEGNALGFIPETNQVRKAIFLLLHNSLVDFFIIACILANCVILYFQVPGVKALRSDSFNSTCERIDLVITIVFTVEAGLRIICLGFIRGRHAYLQNSWNVLDFVLGPGRRGRPARFTNLKITSGSSKSHFHGRFV